MSRAIEGAGHTVVGSVSDWRKLVPAISRYTPHVLVSELSNVIGNPQALANTLHAYPGLPTFCTYPEKLGWEDNLRDFLARPYPAEKPRESICVPRGTHLRVTRRAPPPNTTSKSLRLLALVSAPQIILEGFLLNRICLGEPIYFRAFFPLEGGNQEVREYKSSDVVRVEGPWVLTAGALYQFLKVPPTTWHGNQR